jgi:actin-related protein
VGVANIYHNEGAWGVSHHIVSPTDSKSLIKVKAEKHRKYGAFIGGAMVASLPTFDESMYITRAEMREYGPDIIHRKCF